ncbi:MAG: signal peptide peptidase SppA [Rhodospirillaceae bacterium]|nr:signal peptide peptidase SppA [Rhodospirillaceae bacterium]|tara:strand:+ start:4117 stop:5028 length:912 start_codon:yes stop_codon:yes gene_type:complete
MADDAEDLIERQRLRRRLVFWRLLTVAAVAVALVIAYGQLSTSEIGDHVAVLKVSGVIEGDDRREATLDRIAGDDSVQALIVRINSPGGTFVGGETLYLALQRVAAEKPVVAVMDDVAASAGYMIAMAGDHVIARQGTITGSIGVIFPTTQVYEFFDEFGVTFENIKSDPLKANPTPFEETLPAARDSMQEMVDQLQVVFVSIVDAGRPKLDTAAIQQLADGRVFSGVQALENGLIDELGGDREARAWLMAEHDISDSLPAQDVKIDDDLPWYAEFLRETGKSVLPEPLTLDGLLALWQPDLQ